MVLQPDEEDKSKSAFYKSIKKTIGGIVAIFVVIEVIGRIAAERSSSTSTADNVFLPPSLVSYMNQGLDALFFVLPFVVGIVLLLAYYKYKLTCEKKYEYNAA